MTIKSLSKPPVAVYLILMFIFPLFEIGFAAEKSFTVYITGNNEGILRGCGCPASDYGGLENIGSVFGLDNPKALKLCAGDLFSVKPDSLKEVYILRMGKLLHFDAFLPGDKDLSRSADYIDANFPAVCANLQIDDEYPFKQYLSFNRAGWQIIITGLWSVETYNLLPDNLKKIYKLKDADAAIEDIMGQAAAQCDIFCILTQGPESFDLRLLENYKIDLIVSGAKRKPSSVPIVSAGGILLFAGENCESVTIARFSSANGRLMMTDYMVLPIFMHDPPPYPLFKKLADEYFDCWYRLLEEDRREMKTDRVYLGNGYCKKCHQSHYDSWSITKHAIAFEALESPIENRCIPCHTTGYGYPTGFWDIGSTPRLAGVGCEECHYFDKIPNLQGAHPVEQVSAETCKKCHHPPHDLEFDFESDVLKVLH